MDKDPMESNPPGGNFETVQNQSTVTTNPTGSKMEQSVRICIALILFTFLIFLIWNSVISHHLWNDNKNETIDQNKKTIQEMESKLVSTRTVQSENQSVLKTLQQNLKTLENTVSSSLADSE